MIALYILAALGLLSILFAFTDVVFGIAEWQQRIHIGRWNDRTLWQEALEKKAKSWLIKSPTVKITDQDRLVLWDICTGKYRSNTIQSWQDAGLLLGLDNESALSYAKSHPAIFKKQPLETDYALLAYVLKKKGVLHHEDIVRLDKVFTSFDKDELTIPYRKTLPSVRFVDSIGLICPYLVSTGKSELAQRQIEEFDKILYQQTYPPHAYDKLLCMPLGVYDWSRGIGWYILGLTETPDLPGNKERLLKLAQSILPLQKSNGGFGCMLFSASSRFESSGTALIGILFLKAYELTLDQTYLRASFKVEKALMSATRRNGALDYAQGDTKGIGFYSTTFSIMPFAQGMALYLSKKLNQYVKADE